MKSLISKVQFLIQVERSTNLKTLPLALKCDMTQRSISHPLLSILLSLDQVAFSICFIFSLRRGSKFYLSHVTSLNSSLLSSIKREYRFNSQAQLEKIQKYMAHNKQSKLFFFSSPIFTHMNNNINNNSNDSKWLSIYYDSGTIPDTSQALTNSIYHNLIKQVHLHFMKTLRHQEESIQPARFQTKTYNHHATPNNNELFSIEITHSDLHRTFHSVCLSDPSPALTRAS